MIRPLVLAMTAVICSSTLFAQTPAPETDLKTGINQLISLAESGKHKDVIDGIFKIKKKVEDERSPEMLEKLYNLMAISAAALDDKVLRVRGDFQKSLLRNKLYGAISPLTASAEFELTATYNSRRFERALQIAAGNGLNTVRHLKNKDGQDLNELREFETYLHGFLGRSYARTERKEMALRHFRVALKLGADDPLDKDDTEKLRNIIVEIESAIPPAPAMPEIGACRATPQLTTEQSSSCLKQADRAQLDGDTRAAERILRELIADADLDRLPTERVPAALALHLLLLESHAPNDPAVLRSVDILAGKLAVIEHPAAALVAMRSVMAMIEKEEFSQRLADLCGHIARRAARAGNEDLALRFLDTQIIMLRIGLAKAAKGEESIRIALERALVMLDAASFAELNGYEGLAHIYLSTAEQTIDAFASEPLDKLSDRLADYWDIKRGFVFPGPGAAAEFLGRAALKNPDHPQHDRIIIVWISGETVWRGNDARALALTERLIAEARKSPRQRLLLAELLKARAERISDPQVSTRLLSEAYEIIRKEPDTFNQQVDFLLTLADDSRTVGDLDTALKLVDEADAIAKAHAEVETKHRSAILTWHAETALREGDLPRSIEIAENALRVLVESRKDYAYLRVQPAASLAELYARAGRLADTRRLFETYVFPETSNPNQSGESETIRRRISLAAIESFFAPTKETLAEVETLLRLMGQAASRDEELRRFALRAEAFARYGLGDGLASLKVGRTALAMKQSFTNEKTSTKEDRTLLEVIIGAAVLASTQTQAPSAATDAR